MNFSKLIGQHLHPFCAPSSQLCIGEKVLLSRSFRIPKFLLWYSKDILYKLILLCGISASGFSVVVVLQPSNRGRQRTLFKMDNCHQMPGMYFYQSDQLLKTDSRETTSAHMSSVFLAFLFNWDVVVKVKSVYTAQPKKAEA